MRVCPKVPLVCSIALGLLSSCDKPAPIAARADAGLIVARWSEGELSLQDVRQEAARLPPGLKAEFESPAGLDQLARSLVDKQLLLAEARKRGFADLVDVQRQVKDLETRLAVAALLAAEEKALPPPSDDELRAFYDAHTAELATKPRARVARVLIRAAAPDATKARARLNAVRTRVLKGEAVEKVALEGEGIERAVGGDIGWLDDRQNPVHAAALNLKVRGEATPILETPEGLAVLVLLERVEGRIPTFDEARSSLIGRMSPERQRKAFDALLAKLRAQAKVSYVAKSP